jgi:hypothetical protein
MQTYIVTAKDIKPSMRHTLVSTTVQARSSWEAEQTGWTVLGTRPGTWVVEIVSVELAA